MAEGEGQGMFLRTSPLVSERSLGFLTKWSLGSKGKHLEKERDRETEKEPGGHCNFLRPSLRNPMASLLLCAIRAAMATAQIQGIGGNFASSDERRYSPIRGRA